MPQVPSAAQPASLLVSPDRSGSCSQQTLATQTTLMPLHVPGLDQILDQTEQKLGLPRFHIDDLTDVRLHMSADVANLPQRINLIPCVRLRVPRDREHADRRVVIAEIAAS